MGQGQALKTAVRAPEAEPAPSQIVLLAVRTGSEGNVRKQVKARGMACYWPRYLVNLRHGGMSERALFPGYLFVWAQARAWPMLRSLIGVRDFVRSAGMVQVVSPKVVYALRQREGPTGYVRLDSTFMVGTQVKLKNKDEWAGLYLGMSQTHKARVLFTMLGTNIEIETFASDLAVA